MTALPPDDKILISSRWVNIVITIITVVVTLGCAELAVTFYLNYWANEETFLKYGFITDVRQKLNEQGTRPMFEPHRYLGYIPKKNYKTDVNKHNSLGFRGEEFPVKKPKGEFRIVCMGGSTTYTIKIDDYRKAYPYLLEKILHQRGYTHVKVINAGVGGWSSWESLINYPLRIQPLEPDLIIVLDALNDIHARVVWPHQAYLSDNSGRRGVPDALFIPDWKEYSSIYRILAVKLGWIQPQISLARSLDADPETFWLPRFNRYQLTPDQRSTMGKYKGVSAKTIFSQNKPTYFENNLSNLTTIAKADGVKVVLSTFNLSNDLNFTSSEYLKALSEMNAVIAQVADSQKVSLFRYDQAFPGDPKYYVDDCHVNEVGSQLKATVFANYLEQANLINLPGIKPGK